VPASDATGEAAFFDLDKTVIAKASMVAFGGPLYRHGLVSRRTLARALWGQLVYLHVGADEARLARMRESVLTLIRGWDQAHVSAIVRDTLEAVIEPIIFKEALELLADHRAAGRARVIVSASPEEIVAPLAQYLGVERAIASRAHVDDRGRYTGEMEFYAYGRRKVDAMQAIARELDIDLERSFAYSDSATDLPMLEAVGHPVVVNPDRDLLRLAKAREWEVRRFVQPVRLRDRMPAPTPARTVGSGAAAAAVAAAAVWWWARARRPAAPPPPPPSTPARLRQAARTFLAATAPRAMMMTSKSSFFMGRNPTPRTTTRSR
jgi:HAD superfamily hydrolase (TIGR01490 family)